MIANTITGLRILLSTVLLFTPAFSPVFYTMYLIAALSDMVEGKEYHIRREYQHQQAKKAGLDL